MDFNLFKLAFCFFHLHLSFLLKNNMYIKTSTGVHAGLVEPVICFDGFLSLVS